MQHRHGQFLLTDLPMNIEIISLIIERKPFPVKNQTLRSHRVYISPTKLASSALIQIESRWLF